MQESFEFRSDAELTTEQHEFIKDRCEESIRLGLHWFSHAALYLRVSSVERLFASEAVMATDMGLFQTYSEEIVLERSVEEALEDLDALITNALAGTTGAIA